MAPAMGGKATRLVSRARLRRRRFMKVMKVVWLRDRAVGDDWLSRKFKRNASEKPEKTDPDCRVRTENIRLLGGGTLFRGLGPG